MTRHAASLVIARLLPWLCAVLFCLPGGAAAQTRAWLDRAQVEAGGTVTLNIQTDTSASPDFSPLRADFDLSGQTRSRQVEWANGRLQTRTLHGIALAPRRTGSLVVPPLEVGDTRTPALQLQVSAARPARRDGSAVAFIETDVDDRSPYAQQSVGVVVRLFYAAQLASGALVLETPAGASLQVVGQDRSDVREINGRRYNVVERRYLLIPERSGPLRLAGARFDGRTAGGFFEDFFGSGDGRMHAVAPEQVLQVRAQPAAAPQPWLPLQDLRLRYTLAPERARSGEAATLEVEAVALGATRAQFTELPVPDPGSDAQVFAEPARYEETFSGRSPQLKVTRRYSIVPRAAGTLRVPGLQMRWWDVGSGQARSTRLPDLVLAVAAGRGGGAASTAPPSTVDTEAALPGADDVAPAAPAPAGAAARPWPWIALAGGLLVAWLLTLWWGWRRGRRVVAAAAPASAPAGPTAAARPSLAELRRALDSDGLAEVAAILCAMGGVSRLEQVVAQLDDPRQREAIEVLQRARWGGAGDLPAVRRQLKAALHDGPHWARRPQSGQTGLPPLYPRG